MIKIGDRLDKITIIGECGKSRCYKTIWIVRCDCGLEYQRSDAALKRKMKNRSCKSCATKMKSLTSEQRSLAEKWFEWSQQIARKLASQNYPGYVDDICSAAAFGLVMAARNFDHKKISDEKSTEKAIEKAWKDYCFFKIRYEIMSDLRRILPRVDSVIQ